MNWIGWLISLASLIVAICALVGVGKEIADRKDEAKKQAAAKMAEDLDAELDADLNADDIYGGTGGLFPLNAYGDARLRRK